MTKVLLGLGIWVGGSLTLGLLWIAIVDLHRLVYAIRQAKEET